MYVLGKWGRWAIFQKHTLVHEFCMVTIIVTMDLQYRKMPFLLLTLLNWLIGYTLVAKYFRYAFFKVIWKYSTCTSVSLTSLSPLPPPPQTMLPFHFGTFSVEVFWNSEDLLFYIIHMSHTHIYKIENAFFSTLIWGGGVGWGGLVRCESESAALEWLIEWFNRSYSLPY